MKRIQLFEFTDLPWYPAAFRRMQTDYLQFAGTRGSAYRHLVPLLARVMGHVGTREIIDLCSGSSGPWLRLQQEFERLGQPVHVTLTDQYPDPATIRKWGREPACIRYRPEPVDARRVPGELRGTRTLFEGFHHFPPVDAACILRDALEQRDGIAIFQIVLTPPLAPMLLALSPLITLVSYLLLTPFIRPCSWSRFLWTYLLPVVPLATCWDGIVSLLRVYGLKDLDELIGPLRRDDYTWEAGIAATGVPVFEHVYLLGWPS